MADLGQMNVKVGADISGLLSKVDAAKAKLNQLVESQGQLKDKINDVTTSLRLNEKELTAANVKLQALNTSSKDGKIAATALRVEIAQLAKNSALLNTELTTAKGALVTTTAEIKTQTVAVKQAESSHLGFAKGATQVYSGLRKLAYIIPGMGIAGLISLISGPVIDAFSEWYDSVNKVSDALKTMKANQENLNDIYSESNKEASKQITDLQILYKAATDVTLSVKDRLAAVKGLQSEFPDYFKNLKTENILNGSSKSAYDALTESIIKAARAKAAIGKLDEIAAKQLDNDIQRQKIINATTNEAARARDKVLQQQTTGSSLTGGGAGNAEVKITREEQLKIIEARRDAALKIVDINAKSLQDQANFITKFIGLSDLAKGVESDITPPKTDKVKKATETINDLLSKLKLKLDAISGGKPQIDLDTKQAQEEINAINSAIDTLFTKFKLTNKSKIIVDLRAQVNSLELQIEDKKLRDSLQKAVEKDNAAPIELPPFIVHQQLVDKLEVNIDDKTKADKTVLAATEATRQEMIDKLKKLGVTKTDKVDLGFGTLMSEGLDTASIEKIKPTYDRILSDADKFSNSFKNIMSSTINDAFSGFGQAIGTAIGSGGDIGQAIFGSFFQVLADGIEKLGEAMVTLGTAKTVIEKFAFAPGAGTIIAGVATIALGAALKASLPKFATGGLINGPGSGTSDSILARLSKGEYVLKATTVAKFGVGFFDKLNRGMTPKFDAFGIPKFSTGGLVPNVIRTTQVPSLSGVAIGGQREIFISDSRLRGQDIVTSFKRASSTISRNG